LHEICSTSVWALFYQTVGGAIVIPLYYLAYLRDTRGSGYWSADSRQVPLSYAKSLLPALVLGYLVPTILMFLPYSDANLWTTQGMIALWQPCPFFVNVILWALSTVNASLDASTEESKPSLGDVEYLGSTYTVVFVVSALTHMGTVLVCLMSSDPHHSFGNVFLPRSSDAPSLTAALGGIFQVDFWIIFAASLAWACLAVWDLKRLGKTDISLGKVAALMAAGTVAVGPAATVTGVWYWREHAMAKRS